MSSLTAIERRMLESCLGMGSGYVGRHSDRVFGELVRDAVGVDIHDAAYSRNGTSKANKLRIFWQNESDDRVARLLVTLLDYEEATPQNPPEDNTALIAKCRVIADRLRASVKGLSSLKEHAQWLDAKNLDEGIRRMEAAVATDPRLAIGSAKELIETCCKTILAERGEAFAESADVPELTKATFKALQLVASGVPDERRGAEIIKKLLSNLATVGIGLAELRNLYGTGHGKHGRAGGLTPRHAKLAVGAASTLATFLFETHMETKSHKT